MSYWIPQKVIAQYFRAKFVRSLSDVPTTQTSTLLAIITANADSEFGRNHGFGAIRTVHDYQAAVPITIYSAIEPLVDRVRHGEQNVLTCEPAQYFQVTSGASGGKQKLIPSTSTFQKKVWTLVLASQGFLHETVSQLHLKTDGRGLMFVSTIPMGETEGGIPFSGVSTTHARKSRRVWKWFSAVPYQIATIPDADARRYVNWLFALRNPELAYVYSTYMVSLLTCGAMLTNHQDKLFRDLADGTIDAEWDISRNQRQALGSLLKANPKRAAELRKIAEAPGGLTPKSVWPNLGWIFTVYGATFQNYESQLSDWYSYRFIWGLPYIACEGILGIPYVANSYSHLPPITATFLEFIAENNWDDPEPPTCLLQDLEVGSQYEVVLTSWNGFYRYRIGDIVAVDGKFNGVPTYKVVSRRQSLLSVVWEKTTESQAVKAVGLCEQTIGIRIVDFVIDVDQSVVPPRYRLWAECSDPDCNFDHNRVNQLLDQYLSQINPNYELLRAQGEIGAPTSKSVGIGSFDRFRRRRESEGVPAEQVKILHATKSSVFLDWFNSQNAGSV